MADSYMLDQYQEDSRDTYKVVECRGDLVYPAMGLANEAGELLGKLKKIYRDKDGVLSQEDTDALADEAGDVLWYLTQLVTNLNWTLEDVAARNIDKLQSRKKRGVLGGSGDNR